MVLVRLAAVLGLLATATRAHAGGVSDRCIAAAEAGQRDRDSKRLLRARTEFAKCEATECPALIRSDCVKWLADVESALPSLVFIVRYENGDDARSVRVAMDGTTIAERLDGSAISVDPGEHKFTFDVGERSFEQTLLVQSGERNRLVNVRVPSAAQGSSPAPPRRERLAEPPKAPFPTAAVVTAGVGLLAFGTGVAFGVSAKSDRDALEAEPCAAVRKCDPAQVDSVSRRYVIADIGMAAGVVAVGIATVLWLTRPTSSTTVVTSVGAFRF